MTNQTNEKDERISQLEAECASLRVEFAEVESLHVQADVRAQNNLRRALIAESALLALQGQVTGWRPT